MPDANYFDEKPTADDCLLWRSKLRSEFADKADEVEDEISVYLQRFDVPAPYGQHTIKSGSAPADADAAIDSLVPAEIGIRVRPARAKEKYRKQAEKLQRVGKALLHAWRSEDTDPLAMIAADMVLRRVGVGRVLYDKSLFPKYEVAYEGNEDDEEARDAYESEREDWEISHRRGCPVILEHRNPEFVWWKSHNGKPLVVVEEYRTSALEALQDFRDYDAAVRYINANKSEPDSEVTITDVWVDKWRSQFIDDVAIYPGDGVHPHGYRTLPYILAPFRELPFDEPAKRYRGMLTNAKGLYENESIALTANFWMLLWNAWRTWTGWTVDGRDIKMVPGNFIRLDKRKGEYLELPSGGPVPPELLQFVGIIDQYIQRNGVSQGPRTAEGTRSGQQLWAIQAMRQTKIEFAKRALAKFISRALCLALQELELNVGERVTLPVPGVNREGEDMGEVTFGPGDIRGYWDGWEITFGQRLDPAVLEQAKALSALAQNNWMPWRISVEKSGMTESVQEWEDELIREKTERLPKVLEAAAIEKMKVWYGDEHPYVQALEKMLMAQQAQPGAGDMTQKPMQPGSMKGGPSGGAPGDSLSQAMALKGAKGRGKTGGGGGARNPRGGGGGGP